MRLFLHQDLQRLAAFLNNCRTLGQAYRNRAFDLDDRLEPFLAEIEAYFENRRKSAAYAAAIAGLRNRLETARRGIHPESLVKQKTGRRELVATVCYDVLGSVTEQLSEAYHTSGEALEEARKLLEPTLLSAIQAGFVDQQAVTAAKKSPDASGRLWDALVQRQELRQVGQRILLLVTRHDATLLLFELVTVL